MPFPYRKTASFLIGKVSISLLESVNFLTGNDAFPYWKKKFPVKKSIVSLLENRVFPYWKTANFLIGNQPLNKKGIKITEQDHQDDRYSTTG